MKTFSMGLKIEGEDEVGNKLQKIEKKIDDSNKNVDNTMARALAMYSYVSHITNIISTNIQQAYKGTKAALQAEEIANIIQIAGTEITIGRTTAQAIAAFGLQNWRDFAIYTSLAISLQYNLNQQQMNRTQIREAQRVAEQINLVVSQWS